VSLTSTCPRCDARTDPHGRDGSHTFCTRCREETGFGIDCGKVERADLEPREIDGGRFLVAA
jgi:hypothetical protein